MTVSRPARRPERFTVACRAGVATNGLSLAANYVVPNTVIAQSLGRLPANALATGEKLEDQEKQVILTALKKHHYNRSETARALGISRRALLYKLQRWKSMGEQIGPPEHSESLL